jgi:hypothetical protein
MTAGPSAEIQTGYFTNAYPVTSEGKRPEEWQQGTKINETLRRKKQQIYDR